MEEKDSEKIKEFIEKLELPFSNTFSASERQVEIDEFLIELKKLWETYPHQRFGQMLSNYTRMGTPIDKQAGPSVGLRDFFSYKDSDILADIKKNIQNNK